MLEAEKELLHIFLPDLQDNVEINVELIAHLRKYEILQEKEIEKLMRKWDRQGNSEAVRFMFKALEGGASESLYHLLGAFTQCNQHFLTEKLTKACKTKPSEWKEGLKERVESEVFSKINRSQIHVGALRELTNNTVTRQDYVILETQIVLLKKEVGFLRAKLDDASKTNRSQNEHIELLKKTIDEQKHERDKKLQQVNEKLAYAEAQCHKFEYENYKLLNDRKNLVEQTERECSKIENEKLAYAEAQCHKFKDENDKLLNDRKNLVEQIERQCSKIDEEQTKIDALCHDSESLRQQIDKLSERIKTDIQNKSSPAHSHENQETLDRCIREHQEIEIKLARNDNKINKLYETVGLTKNTPASPVRNKHYLTVERAANAKRQRTLSEKSDCSSGSSEYTDAPSSVASRRSSCHDEVNGLLTLEVSENTQLSESETEAKDLTKCFKPPTEVWCAVPKPCATSKDNSENSQTKLQLKKTKSATYRGGPRESKQTPSLPVIRLNKNKPTAQSLGTATRVMPSYANRQSDYQTRKVVVTPVVIGGNLEYPRSCKTPSYPLLNRAKISTRRTVTTTETVVVEEPITPLGMVGQPLAPTARGMSESNRCSACTKRAHATTSSHITLKEKPPGKYTDSSAGPSLGGVSFLRARGHTAE